MKKTLWMILLVVCPIGGAQAEVYCDSLSGGGYNCIDHYGQRSTVTPGYNGGVKIEQNGRSTNVTRDTYGGYNMQHSDGLQSHMNRNSGGGYTINHYGPNGRSSTNCSQNLGGGYSCR